MFTHVLSGVLDAFSQDIAIDLGTTHTFLYVQGRGVVCREPTMVAVHQNRRGDRQVIAVGREAKRMRGRTPSDIQVISPVRDGVIADFQITEALLRHLIIQVVGRSPVVGPNAMVCIPYGTTEVERRAMRESAEAAGARCVSLVDEPLAAAVGLGMDLSEPRGNMVVDVGGGTCEVSVLSLSGVVYARSVKVAGDQMDEAIVQHVRRHYGLLIGRATAEAAKIRFGSLAGPLGTQNVIVKGRDLASGFPRAVEFSQEELRMALADTGRLIAETVLTTLEKTPPELAGDIVDQGIVLIGGGAMLRGLDRVLRDATGIPAILAEDPMAAMVVGSGRVMEEEWVFEDTSSRLSVG